MPKIPTDTPAVPSHVNWDLWLGLAKKRPYHPTYCPYGWRFWWDFGTGEMGNWGCHLLDVSFWALDLKSPTRVEASGPAVHDETTPKAMHAIYQLPASVPGQHFRPVSLATRRAVPSPSARSLPPRSCSSLH